MILVMGHALAAAGEIDRVTAGLQAMLAATNAEEGCLHYSFSRDITNPDRMLIAERWQDQAALDAHFATPHMASFQALLSTVNMVEVSIKAWDGTNMRTLA